MMTMTVQRTVISDNFTLSKNQTCPTCDFKVMILIDPNQVKLLFSFYIGMYKGFINFI